MEPSINYSTLKCIICHVPLALLVTHLLLVFLKKPKASLRLLDDSVGKNNCITLNMLHELESLNLNFKKVPACVK